MIIYNLTSLLTKHPSLVAVWKYCEESSGTGLKIIFRFKNFWNAIVSYFAKTLWHLMYLLDQKWALLIFINISRYFLSSSILKFNRTRIIKIHRNPYYDEEIVFYLSVSKEFTLPAEVFFYKNIKLKSFLVRHYLHLKTKKCF